MYTENSHPLSHTFVTIRGGKPSTSSSYSDSDSSSSSIKNYESSNDENDDKTDLNREYSVPEYGVEEGESSNIKGINSNSARAKIKCERKSSESIHDALSEDYADDQLVQGDHDIDGNDTYYNELTGQQTYLTETVCLQEADENEVQNLPYDYLHTIMLSNDNFTYQS